MTKDEILKKFNGEDWNETLYQYESLNGFQYDRYEHWLDKYIADMLCEFKFDKSIIKLIVISLIDNLENMEG